MQNQGQILHFFLLKTRRKTDKMRTATLNPTLLHTKNEQLQALVNLELD